MAIQHTITDEGSHVLIVSTGYQPSRQRINKQTHDLKKMKDGQGVEFLRISSGPTTILDIYHAEVASPVTGNIAALEVVIGPYFFNVGRGGYAFYKEITITSAELLNNLDWGGGANPFIVLPAITNGYSPRWVAVHENHFGGAAYTNVSPAGFWSQVPASGTATLLVSLPVTAMNYAWDRVIPNIQPQMNISNVMPIHGLGEQIIFKLLNSTNQTGGNGYVVLKIWYDIEIFAT